MMRNITTGCCSGLHRLLYLSLLLLAPIIISACATTTDMGPPLIPEEDRARPIPREYRIQQEDQLEVKFYYNNDLNDQVTVRPDGFISLQLIEDVKAAGLTPSQLTKVLKERYASVIANTEITVIVRSFQGQKIYVDGEVNNASMVKLTGPMTVMQAISSAGGLRRTARESEVLVIRRNVEKPLIIQVDLTKVVKGDISQDILLKPYDIVYVPRTPISYVNQWVREYLREIIPYSVGWYYNL